jgi:hypothetical protein
MAPQDPKSPGPGETGQPTTGQQKPSPQPEQPRKKGDYGNVVVTIDYPVKDTDPISIPATGRAHATTSAPAVIVCMAYQVDDGDLVAIQHNAGFIQFPISDEACPTKGGTYYVTVFAWDSDGSSDSKERYFVRENE